MNTEQQEKFYSLARSRMRLSEAKYKSFSGADMTDAVRHDLEAKAFRVLGLEGNLEETLELIDKDWRKFAAERNKEVENAPKLKQGPSSGLSSIHYKWANPDAIEDSKIFIRNMYKQIMK